MKLKARWLAYLLSAMMAVTLLSGADVTDLDVYAAEEKPGGEGEGSHVQENGPGADEQEKDESPAAGEDSESSESTDAEEDSAEEEDVDEDAAVDAEDADDSDDTADSEEDDDSSEDAEDDEDTEDEDDSESEDETESEEDEDEESDETEETEEESEGDEDADADEGGSASAETSKGITVSVSWEEGTFAVTPDGIAVSDVSDAERTVSDYYEREDKSVEVIDAVGVDISFYVENEDGEKEEIEPLTNEDGSAVSAVSVTISLPSDQELQTTEDAEIVVLHESDADDRGGKTEITELSSVDSADAESVTFEADSFSTYYVVVKSSTSEDETSKEIIVSMEGIDVLDDSGDYSAPEDLAEVTSSDNLIQEAIDYIYSQGDPTGWTITIESGTYSRFTVLKGLDGLTVQAADNAEVIISVLDGSDAPATTSGAYPETGGVSIRDVANVTLDGLTFEAGSEQSSPWYAAAVSTYLETTTRAENPTIENCTFIGVGSNYGYFSNQVNSWTIENCSFDSFNGAIEFYGDNVTEGTVVVSGNTFTNCSFAIHGYSNGGNMSFTNNTVTGTSSLRSKVVFQDQYGYGYLTVTVSGNILTNAMIGLVNLTDVDEDTASYLKSQNTLDENSYVVVATNDEGSDYSTIYFSPESSHGYWALTYISDNDDLDVSWGGNPEGTDDYVKSVIDAANASGSHTLSFSVLDEDLIKTFTWFKDAIYWVGSDVDEEEPSVEKFVDKNTVEAGDTVTFTLFVSAPEYLEIYGTTSNYDSIIRYPTYVEYYVTVHDVMDKVFRMNNDLSVSVNGREISTAYYRFVVNPDDGCSFEIVIDFAKLLDDGILTANESGVYPDVVITYTATVSESAKAGTYKNTTWVSYENERSDFSTVEVEVPEEDEPSGGGTIGSGGLAIVKIDAETGEYLAGATFALYRTNDDSLVGTYTTDENGWLSVSPLTYETYYFVEIEAPEGYVLDSTPIHVSLTSDLSYSAEYPWVIVVKNTKSGIEVTTTTDTTDTTTDATDTTGTTDTTVSGSDTTGTTSVTETGTVTATARDAGATGDDGSLMFWIVVMVLSGAGLGAAAFYTRRRKAGR